MKFKLIRDAKWFFLFIVYAASYSVIYGSGKDFRWRLRGYDNFAVTFLSDYPSLGHLM